MRLNALYSVLLTFLSFVLNAQSGQELGSWHSHLASNSATTLTKAGSIIYAGSSFSMFGYETSSGTLKTLSKVDGLSRSDVSKIGYSEATETLVIGYINGHIDLIKNSIIYRIYDIYNATIAGSKRINHLLFVGDRVWISTDFGLVVYNLTKREVSEVYSNFSSTTSQVQVYSSSNFDDSLFVATSSGVYKASASSSVNKLDYRNWKMLYPPSLASVDQIRFLQSYSGHLYLCGTGYILKYSKGAYSMDFNLPSYNFYNVLASNGKLWFLLPSLISSYNGSVPVNEVGSTEISQPMELVQGSDGTIWVADNYFGLVEKKVNAVSSTLAPNGPLMNTAFTLSKYQDKIIAVAGGFDIDYAFLGRQGAFSVYDKGRWNNYSANLGNFFYCTDVVSYTYNPVNNKTFIGSFGWGVVEWDGLSDYKLWDNHNSPLNTCNVGDFCKTEKFCKVGGTSVDNTGKLWVINHQDVYNNNTPGTLFSYDLNGNWSPIQWRGWDKWGIINYSQLEKPDLVTFNKLYIDKNNTKWMVSRAGGLLAYNENYSANPRYMIYDKGRKEEICGTSVYSITCDLEGAIWIGTDNGVCYYSDAKEVFQMKSLKAALPVYQNRALLSGNKITALEVDGGNRKWIGTSTSGAWLFSSDGSTLIAHFDQSNSPLPSDYVIDIKINDKTGEVFVATDKGIFSYLSDAILGEDQNMEIMAYPNPITRDFNGQVAISGLVKDAKIKITDISGQLVYQTKAQGSLASWNVKDYTGRRVQPGIYLVFSSKEDGSEALATKIAVVD